MTTHVLNLNQQVSAPGTFFLENVRANGIGLRSIAAPALCNVQSDIHLRVQDTVTMTIANIALPSGYYSSLSDIAARLTSLLEPVFPTFSVVDRGDGRLSMAHLNAFTVTHIPETNTVNADTNVIGFVWADTLMSTLILGVNVLVTHLCDLSQPRLLLCILRGDSLGTKDIDPSQSETRVYNSYVTEGLIFPIICPAHGAIHENGTDWYFFRDAHHALGRIYVEFYVQSGPQLKVAKFAGGNPVVVLTTTRSRLMQ